jgi:hypothetical protein
VRPLVGTILRQKDPTEWPHMPTSVTYTAVLDVKLSTALERAKAAGLTHLNLDGTVIRTDHIAAPGPNGADLWWSGKHKHHGGNVQVIATPDGWPIWVSPVRPGREHDTTCARHHGLVEALNRIAAELDMPTLVDLGYENVGDGFRHPHKKPAGGELTEASRRTTRSSAASTASASELPAQDHLQGTAQGQLRPQPHHEVRERSPPRPSSCSSSSTTAPSEQSHTVVIHYWQRLNGPVCAGE